MSDPQTPPDLWDRLQELFGFGAYDETTTPYYKFRMTGIAILKRTMAARRASVQQTWMIAQYCHEHRLRVRTYPELFSYWVEAQVEQRRQQHDDASVDTHARLSNALAHADMEWVGRLLRAHPASLPALLDEYEREQT